MQIKPKYFNLYLCVNSWVRNMERDVQVEGKIRSNALPIYSRVSVPPLAWWKGQIMRRDFFGNSVEIVNGSPDLTATPERSLSKLYKLRVTNNYVQSFQI
jgi:hypothetical protein